MSDEGRVIGRVVYSTAGRDKKRPFVIVGVEPDGSVLIADGRLRTVARPKRKNLAHLDIRDVWVGESDFQDGTLREFLRNY